MTTISEYSSISNISKNFSVEEDTSFFPNYEDDRSWDVRFLEGLKEFFYLIGSFFSFVAKYICSIFTFKSLNLENEEDKVKITDCDKDLCVFIPGLSASPTMWMDWKKSIDELENLNVCVVKLKNGGMQRVDDTVKPIFDAIKEFADKYPLRKIAIIGISLGGLSSLLIEHKLRESEVANRLMTVSLAGAFGTKTVSTAKRVVDVLKKVPVFDFFLNLLPISLLNSFSVGNQPVQDAISFLRKDNDNTTKRYFISGKGDTTVSPPSNCHPLISVSDEHLAYGIRGHISLKFDETIIEFAKGKVDEFLSE